MGYIPKLIELPEDDVEKFKQHYPQRGALTWFLREALHRFNELHTVDTDELIKLAVQDIHS